MLHYSAKVPLITLQYAVTSSVDIMSQSGDERDEWSEKQNLTTVGILVATTSQNRIMDSSGRKGPLDVYSISYFYIISTIWLQATI